MANIVITSTTNSIKVDFGDYAASLGMSKGVWRKEQVRFNLKPSNLFVEALIYNEPPFAVSFDGSTGTLQVDSIDTVTPTSNSDLYDKLIALIA